MMNKRQFKAGDLVYYPRLSCGTFRVQKRTGNMVYPLKFYLEDGFEVVFTEDGKLCSSDKTASIFHATHEMKAKLEDLHGVEFEAPPAKPTSRDIVKSRLAKGEKFVPCYAHDSIVEPNHLCFRVYIQGIHEDGRYIDDNHELWEYVTPFDPATDEPITQLAQ